MNLRQTPLCLLLFAATLVSSWAASSVILKEDFQEPDSLGLFNQVSVASNFAWRWRENDFDGRFAEMSGFNADGPSDDWLILNDPLDLGDVANPNMSFRYIARFGGPDMELLASTDYDPNTHADPGDATWTSLPFFAVGTETEPNPDSWSAQFSDTVDLSGFQTDGVYLAFHYTSTGSESGEGRVWRVDDIVIADSDPDAILLLSEFEDLEPWTGVDVSGGEEWGVLLLGDREGAAVDGAFTIDSNDDWLISPALAIGENDIPVVNFDYYTEGSGPGLEMLVSNDYNAETHSDPSAATWTILPLDLDGIGAESWTSVTGNSFFGITGDAVHVAFRYRSIGGEAPQGRVLGVGNVCVFKAVEAPALTAEFAVDSVQPTTAEAVQFTAQTTGGKRPYTYAWDFGDGGSSTDANPMHTFANAGVYTVSVTATDAFGGASTQTKTDFIHAVNEANVVLKIDFEGADEEFIPTPWEEFSVASDADWRLNTEASRSGAVISGFGADVASEDWLLSPKITLVGSEIPVLAVDVFTRFDGPLLDILVSSDYSGGNPNNATWTSLNVDFSTLPEQVWTEAAGLSLAGLDGEFTLAFKYVSTGFGSGDGRTYGIDNVRVINETEIPVLSSLRIEAATLDATTEDGVSFRPFITGGKHPYQYAWDFGDGETSSDGAPMHTFAQAGEYTVSLKVTDATGEEREASLPAPVQVIDASAVLFSADFSGFDGDDPATPDNGWQSVSLMSNRDWQLDTFDGQQGAFVNGFGGDDASDDWLISPIIAIAEGESATLSFDLNRFFDGGTFDVLASTDYDPASEDPNAATWSQVGSGFTDDDWSRPSELAIPLAGDVRIAFHYTSTGTGPGDGQRIGVDEIQVVKKTAPPMGDDFLNTDFEGEVDAPIDAPWTTVSVASDAVWDIQEWNGRLGAFMNGFGADAASEDWLISPAMDLTTGGVPVLSFGHFVRFGGPDVQVLVSTDYDPGAQSDPNDATWSDLQIDFSGQEEREWIDYADINLAGFAEASTYLAFKYVSNGAAGGDGRLVGIDSVIVAKSDSAPALVVDAVIPTIGGTGETLSFSASGSGGARPYTFTWTMGDGTELTGAEVTHVYEEIGTYQVTVKIDDGAGASQTQSGEIEIAGLGDTILAGLFEGDDDSPIAAPWLAVSVASDRDWQVDSLSGSQGAVANGFGADVASDDWLISPPFSIDFWSETTLSFDYFQNFSGPELEVLITGDFEEGMDPNSVQWLPVAVDLADIPNSEWTRQRGISLNAFAGQGCRLAFRYVTTGTEGGDGKLIGINDVKVQTVFTDRPAPETYDFGEWKAVRGHFKANDPNGAADADPEGDGFTNGFEWRFDLDPRSGTGYGNLPQIERTAEGVIRVTYQRISDEQAWKVEISSDLMEWAEAVEGQDITTSIQKNDELGEVVETVQIDFTAEATFLRVVLP